ncbi:MAG TPA: ABC transporter ATP-binding protein [Acidimicrobiales bacterium]|nr:ABC transporter ATP-binding protein [Acidimicrobiales bacterium]
MTKRFGSVVACRNVSLSVERGEIHGLLGENGAGKSTLMKVLIGLIPADGGEVRLAGRPIVVKDPVHAAALGLAMAQQHFSLIERLKVWENVALAHRGKLSRRQAVRVVGEIGRRYGLEADPEARVEDLTVGQRQRVEVIKCLSLDPDVLILDEPTSVLSASESRELFGVLREVVLRDQRAVILISHKLDEILQATDRVTIMRDGSVVESMATSEADAHRLARAMVGRDVLLQAEMAAVGLRDEVLAAEESADPSPGAPASPGTARVATGRAPALRIVDVEVRAPDGRMLLDGLSLEVGHGEIVGVAGVEGNGQAAIGDLLSGLARVTRGRIEVDGEAIGATSPRALLAAGVGVIPEDRHRSGCVLQLSVAENLVVSDLGAFTSSKIFLDRKAILRRAVELIEAFDISTPSPTTPMSALSGGNQQRVVVARELARGPTCLVAVQPTRGLDVGAVEYMSEQLRKAAAAGVGILLVSTELDEILAIAHRIVVLYRGSIVGEMRRDEVNVERLGLLMGGRQA